MIAYSLQSAPTVSVSMCVYNEAAWVAQAINSILDQTFTDFELLITDDGSVDGTRHILSTYEDEDPRVHIIMHDTREGLAGSLNEQISLAKGKYLARMDGDDVARSDRLAIQVAYLDAHPRVGILGSFCQEIDSEGRPVCIWSRPTENHALQKALLRYNPFIHSTIMLRQEIFDKTGPYSCKYRYAQDYELWLRAARKFELANIPEPLIDLRVEWGKLARKNREARRCELRILYRHIKTGAYPMWYYAFLCRPLLWGLLPTGWMMKLKSLQRRMRQSIHSNSLEAR
jgi:glycosyltransferase involved in cell wall biosynthesis